MLPVRCFTCGKVLGNKEEVYTKMLKDKIKPVEIFKKLGITRYCCKRMLLTNINIE